MAQQNSGVVVWEWLSDHGRWKPYKPSIIHAIEANSHSNTPLGLGEIEPSMSAYAIDFTSCKQIRLNTGTARSIRRRTFPDCSAPGKGVEWQWLDDTGWSSYDLDAAIIIEDAHSQGTTHIDLSQTTCRLPYLVDFSNMEQTRKGSGFKRKIQRVTITPYPKFLQTDDGSNSDDGRSLPGSSSDHSVATVTASSAPAVGTTLICIAQSSSTVPRPMALVAPPSSSTSTLISDDVVPETSTGTNNNPTSATNVTGSRSSKRVVGKRTGSRKAVAATSGVQATVAWSTPPGSTIGTAASSSTVSSSSTSSLPRSTSVPEGMGPEMTVTATLSSASASAATTGVPIFSHSATTSCLAAAAAATAPRMTRSQSTPCNVTAKPAHAAGAKLSPIMTGKKVKAKKKKSKKSKTHKQGKDKTSSAKVKAITSMLLSTAVPIKVNPTPIPVFSPPPTSRGGIRPVEGVKPSKKKRKTSFSRVDNAEDVLKNYVTKIKKLPDEDCPICYEKLADVSHFSEETSPADDSILKLNNCGHLFHRSCLNAMYNSGPKDGSIQCPTCKAIYGVKHGNQPPGRMDYHVIPHSLPGYPDCGTIRIIYDIPPGTQGEEHPNPGKRYSARGFPRHCYLPDIPVGQKILKLLVIAWERRLLFTIATSATTGEPSTVVWNEIHHKTEFGSNVTGHGFPDPNYFDNVLSELASQGVTEDCLGT